MNEAIPTWLPILGVVLFALPGLWLMGMSLDAVPALGGQLLAPRWIVALTGLIFVNRPRDIRSEAALDRATAA